MDKQVQLEAKEPSHGEVATLGQPPEHFVTVTSLAMGNEAAIETAGTSEVSEPQTVHTGHCAKAGAEIFLHPIAPEMFESPVGADAKQHHDEQHLSLEEDTIPDGMTVGRDQLVRLPLLDHPGKVIETAEESDARALHEGSSDYVEHTDTEPGLA